MNTNVRRVLVLAGGGMRGYLQVKWLQKFIIQQGITEPLYKIFDVIAGTSIGAINALSIAYGKELNTLEQFFLEKGKRVFTVRTATEKLTASHNASLDSNRPNDTQKIALIIANDPFYKSPYGDSNFGHNILHQTLVDNFSNDTLQTLKTNVLVPVYNSTAKTFVKFSNYAHDFYYLPNSKIVDVLRATSAAPIYFPSYLIGNNFYKDGGIHLNLAADNALTFSKIIKPTAKKTRLLVLGTGKERAWIVNDGTITPEMTEQQKKDVQTGSAIADLFELYNLASTGAQEEALSNLELLSRYTYLDDLAYYAFDPLLNIPLDITINGVQTNSYIPPSVALDNSDPKFLAYMSALVDKDFIDNAEKISIFSGKLLA